MVLFSNPISSEMAFSTTISCGSSTMACVSRSSSPNSFQLHLLTHSRCRAQNSRVFLRRSFRAINWSIRCSLPEKSWVEPEPSSPENFSGWSSPDSGQRRRGYGGIMVAGAAGLILAAGVAFASVSLKKKTGLKEQMRPLTAEQEILLASDDQKETDEVKDITMPSSNEENPNPNFAVTSPPADPNTVLQVAPGKVVVPAIVDQVQGQALAALQVLKVIESDVKASDLCSRREYARWLVAASSALSRSSISKVYPAMYIENVTDLAFDDITPEDPDFPYIQGLAEAGLISSKLTSSDLLNTPKREPGGFIFSPDSPLSRQDLVSWKMALEKKQLPEVNRKVLYQRTGYMDVDKINPDAWPALVADISAGDQSITALAFGYTRLFQPQKPVTKAQAAIALATGDATEFVTEELTRIEAESLAETAVAAHTALVAQVEEDLNATFEMELALEREKIDAVEKLAEEVRVELENIKAERDKENSQLMMERDLIESEIVAISKLRHDVEEQLQNLISDKMEILFEKDKLNGLRKATESENQALVQLQYELEVERKALSMARAWAEDEAKRAREHAKALEDARERWERRGIKVIVDEELSMDALDELTWTSSEKFGGEISVSQTVGRAESLREKLKAMANEVSGKSQEIIEKIIRKIEFIITSLKRYTNAGVQKSREFYGATVSMVGKTAQDLCQSSQNVGAKVGGFLNSGKENVGSFLRDGTKKITEECREGMEKFSQKFKT
ncbi:uncharacterized protein LOC18422877 isoform X4 [Amborella trichopoda]|uniref:uncharacterized protein LOC18422877 isoform X4 n=1 Tax=Amborella trichopoda TaxID=13333 RepID=UPI0005D30101|nr:uncharacterized protein LOC18422877 isoform X4 [Amborella trichopoda]|eukprot:XP_011625051.1 uncharacterized protein LOC18422877 isoform X4 [Amborella trichopoda]